MGMMERHCVSQVLALTDSFTGAVELNKSGMAMGTIFVPAGSSITAIDVEGAPHSDDMDKADSGDFTVCCDTAGDAIQIVVAAGKNYPLPVELASVPHLRFKANTAGTIRVTVSG